MSYREKYLKYKKKYNDLVKQSGGFDITYSENVGSDMINDLSYMERNGLYYTTDYSNLENVVSFPMGHHTFTDFKDDRSSIIRDTNDITVRTYPNFNQLIKPKNLNISYNKIPNVSTQGTFLNQYDNITEEQCASKCSEDRYCNSFNMVKNKKSKKDKKNQKTCQHSVNNHYFVPQIIKEDKNSDYYNKNINKF